MSNNIDSSWILASQSLVSLLGAEYSLTRNTGVLRRFYISSLLIIIILILSWISINYALDLLFHTLAVEITLAIFFCLLFFCIYIFLLNTFAKENRAQKRILNVSNVIRIGFVAFKVFLIAQPLIILLYSAALLPAVKNYKEKILNEHMAKIDILMKDEIAYLVNRRLFYTVQKNRFNTKAYDNELDKIASRLNTIRLRATFLKQTAQKTVDRSSFFLFRIEKANREYPLSRLLTLFIILLFLLPGYLIYSIPSQHEYYKSKKTQEKELVAAAYNLFARRYKTMFHEQVIIFSRYEDPPFNTIRKQPPILASMADFLKKYLETN